MQLVNQPDGFTAYGVDGCPAGWFVVTVRPTGKLEWQVLPTMEDLIRTVEESARIFVDIPIGLPVGSDERECDREARQMLRRPRGSSVFRVPVREVLKATSFSKANAISRRATSTDSNKGKGITKQTFAIVPKISEVDSLLRGCHKARGLVREIHPEVCFAGLAGHPMKHRKKKRAGFEERRSVLGKEWSNIDELIDHVLEETLRKCVERDDVLDAAVAAFTACQDERLLRSLPAKRKVDAHGLPMEMVYAAAD